MFICVATHNFPQKIINIFSKNDLFFPRSAEHAIQTIVYCATDANLSEQTGLYYSDCAVQLTPDKAADMEDAYR